MAVIQLGLGAAEELRTLCSSRKPTSIWRSAKAVLHILIVNKTVTVVTVVLVHALVLLAALGDRTAGCGALRRGGGLEVVLAE